MKTNENSTTQTTATETNETVNAPVPAQPAHETQPAVTPFRVQTRLKAGVRGASC
jgi:hypothetical protein